MKNNLSVINIMSSWRLPKAGAAPLPTGDEKIGGALSTLSGTVPESWCIFRVDGYIVSRCGRNTMLSRTLEGLFVIADDVGFFFPFSRSHFSLYNLIFIDRLSGLTIGATRVSRYCWLIVSSGWTGNSEGERRYNSVFLYFCFEALVLSYGYTLKLLFPKSAVIVNGPLAL